MDIEMIREKDNKLEFSLKGGPVYFANLIRRYAIGQVPVFAIDRVTFYENSSPMFDEYLAHRLGEVPLTSDVARSNDEIVLTLEASGPGVVYSKSLKSTDSKIKAALDDIPLLKLLEGQNLRLEAKARSGIGREHGKFQAGLISYEVLKPNELRLKTESFMQIEPRALLAKSADLVIAKCEELEEALAEVKKAKE
ncbi:MAG: DNA-directed RNA polymerase subunit D [Candidatus Micrarchaeota archaeon]|nr:DNA-directed RNA polymerase subunit D [Candidatus Micrarchaeota archaeon]